jgi:hypothetical protein
MNKIIYLHNSKKDIDIWQKKYKDIILYSGKLEELYNGNFYNPPFFNTIICSYKLKNEHQIKMLWNMLLSGGFLILLECCMHFFHETPLQQYVKKYDKKYIIIEKKKPKINIFYNKSRIIDFMIIGVQKGGTTAAMENLEKHPEIHIPDEEIHYYENDWTKDTLEMYKKKFDYSKKLVGEKDPNIIFMPHIYPLIQQINPYVKMILFLRNPIDRAYSAWYMFHTKYFTSKNDLKGFQNEMEIELSERIDEPINYRISNAHYLQRGLYYKQIKELLRFFPRENIYICLSEKVINEMDTEYKKIYDFLDISYPKEDINYEKKLVGSYASKDKKNDITPSFYKKLVSFFKDDVKKLEKEILGYKTNWFTKKS